AQLPVPAPDIVAPACSVGIRDLLLVPSTPREENPTGVIPTPPPRNTLPYRALTRFPHTLGIPTVATIRDSQNYVRGAELGIGVHEMKSYVAQEDVAQWVPLVDWLARPAGAAPTAASSQDAGRAVGDAEPVEGGGGAREA